MTRFSRKASLARQLAIFGFFALSIPLTVSSSKLSPDQVKQAGWRVELGEGKQTRSTLTINNRCSEPHLFRITSNAKYLLFEERTESVLINASASRQLGARFDATGLKPKVYKTNVVVKCLDCKKKGSTCTQDRDEVSVELTVTKPSMPAREIPPGYKPMLLAIGGSVQKERATKVSKIMLHAEAATLRETEGLVEVNGRESGRYLIVEFTAPLPNKSRQLIVDSNMPIDDVGVCMVAKGIYNLDYSKAKNGSARLALIANTESSMFASHRRRPSRR